MVPTSVLFQHHAVRSLTSLCLMITSPPLPHDSAWFTSNPLPQGHCVGKPVNSLSYLILNASQNSPLGSLYPGSFSDRAVNQLEEPLSAAFCTALFILGSTLDLIVLILSSICSFLQFLYSGLYVPSSNLVSSKFLKGIQKERRVLVIAQYSPFKFPTIYLTGDMWT